MDGWSLWQVFQVGFFAGLGLCTAKVLIEFVDTVIGEWIR